MERIATSGNLRLGDRTRGASPRGNTLGHQLHCRAAAYCVAPVLPLRWSGDKLTNSDDARGEEGEAVVARE